METTAFFRVSGFLYGLGVPGWAMRPCNSLLGPVKDRRYSGLIAKPETP